MHKKLDRSLESSVKAQLQNLLNALRDHGLRVTEPRIAVLKVFLESHGPFSAEEVYTKVTRKACDLATIYRTLTSLEKAQVVRRCDFGDGTLRFEIADKSDPHHHHHIICKICKQIEVLDDCELDNLDQFAQKRGFTQVTHSLEFFGICKKCSTSCA